MNKKIFEQILSDVEGIAAAQGVAYEEINIKICTIDSRKIITNEIYTCDGYVRIYSPETECYEFIPYSAVTGISF